MTSQLWDLRWLLISRPCWEKCSSDEITEIQDKAGNVWYKEEARKKRLNEGVNGAHICIFFQCELCWVRNLEGKDHIEGDEKYIMSLIRAQLGALSRKSHLSIKGHQRVVVAKARRCESIRKTPSYEPQGSFPLDDPISMGLEVDMLLKSPMATGESMIMCSLIHPR